MHPPINKELVKKRFKKSLKTYNNHAIVQETMAKKLVKILLKQTGNTYGNILEIGCGTGFLTQNLIQIANFENFYANDIVEESASFINKISKDILFINGDAETVNFQDKFDLIISNATFQWISDLPKFFSKLSSHLNKDGIIAFSSFGRDNICEISKITNNTLLYNDVEEVEAAVKDHLRLVYSEDEKTRLLFETPKHLLTHMRYTGVNGITQEKPWTKTDLEHFEKAYYNLFSENGRIYLTYHPIYCIFEKI